VAVVRAASHLSGSRSASCIMGWALIRWNTSRR
jgi:hypothetical protein